MIANNVVNPPAMGVSKANRLLAVMCYVGLFVVPLLVLRNTDKGKNPFLHSHAAQALEIQYWTAFTVACVFILDYVIQNEMLGGSFSWAVRFFAGVCSGFALSAQVVLSVIASYSAINGEEHEFPQLRNLQ